MSWAPSPIRDRFVSIPSEIPVSVKNEYALQKLGCYLVFIQISKNKFGKLETNTP